MILAVLFLLGGLGLFAAAKPAYRAAKIWRAGQLLSRAEKFAEKDDWRNAYQSIREASTLVPDDAKTTRAIARFLGKRQDPQALALSRTLIDGPESEPEDRIELVRLALRLDRLSVAHEQLSVLLRAPKSSRDFEVLRLASQWSGRSGEHPQAIAFARQALAQAGNPREAAEAKLALSGLLLDPAAAQAPQFAEAKQHLHELEARDDQIGLEALLLLTVMGRQGLSLSPGEAEAISTRLSLHPLASEEQRLLGLASRLELHPDRREPLLDEVIKACPQGNAERTAMLGKWLMQQREAQRVLALIPLEKARKNQPLLLIHLDALASAARWSEIEKLLGGAESLPMELAIRRLYLVRTAMALGRTDELADRWYEVQQAVRREKPETILYVAEYAARLGKPQEAAKAYSSLSRVAGGERSGYLGLVRLAEQAGTRPLRDAVQELATRFPSDLEPQNDLAYLNLLLNEEIPAASETAGRLVKRAPELLAYRTTQALAFLRAGNAAAAGAVYREFQTDWSSAQPGWQAVSAAVLAAEGNLDLARTRARQVPLARLKPEERALIADLL
ncbi:MAG: hypothetical protein QOE70_2394 [Chthoniobacter sp.]|jgi:hypothetical protein|nr:hypothetical protein [Chthoniobacter sp.]